MGSFMGHVLPGSFFIVFSIWWIIASLNRYYRGRYRKSGPFKGSLTYPCFCCSDRVSRLQIEGILKIVVTSIGLTGEIYTGIISGPHALIGNGQHATMFAFFGASGIIDILSHYKVPLPKRTDYVFSILCFVVEALLFMFHLHGRSPFDIAVHKLLVYVIWCCVLSGLAEMCYPHQIFCTLARSFFVFLQGTWFIQVGAMLYPPFNGMKEWKGHGDIMIATIIFAWHMFCIFLFILIIAFINAKIHGRNSHVSANERNHGNSSSVHYCRPGDEVGLIQCDEDEDTELGINGYMDETKLLNGH